jgi:hypothetical protein
MLKIRLIAADKSIVEGKVIRVTKVRVIVEAQRLRHTCNRSNGTPCGTKGLMTIHPDDLHLVQDDALIDKTYGQAKIDRRLTRGVAGHWDV